jgi:predicted Fe-Mo cluster-binding NifX family protein
VKAPSSKDAEPAALFAVCVDSGDSRAQVDESFGTCRFFAIYRGDGTLQRFAPNPAAEQPGGTTIKAVNCLTRQGVKTVVAARYGQRALELLSFAVVAPYGCERGLALHRVTALFLQGSLNRW